MADSFSRLPKEDDVLPIESHFGFAENFGSDALDDDVFPVSYFLTDEEQQKDKTLLEWLKHGHHGTTIFLGGEKSIELITWKDKIVIPSALED